MNEYDELTLESVCSQPSAGRNGDGRNGDTDTDKDTSLEEDEMRKMKLQMEEAMRNMKLQKEEEMRKTKLQKDEEAGNVSREERKMRAIIRQIEEMEHKEKAVEAGPCSSHLEGRVGHENEKVGEKHRFRDACDTGGGEAAAQGPCGEEGAGTQSTGMVSRAHVQSAGYPEDRIAYTKEGHVVWLGVALHLCKQRKGHCSQVYCVCVCVCVCV